MSATPPAPPDFPTSPYAPPSVDAPPPAPALARGVGPTDWTISEAITYPFRVFTWRPTKTLVPLALPTLVLYGLMFAFQFAEEMVLQRILPDIAASPPPEFDDPIGEVLAEAFGPHLLPTLALTFVWLLLNVTIQTWLMLGMYRFGLRFARGELPTIGSLFAFGPGLGAAFLAILLSTFFTALGMVALIVPGIILSLGWALALPVIADGETSPVRALGESWRLMRGSKGRLFLAGLLGILIGVASLCFCVSFLWVLPGFALAGTYVYLRLRGETPGFPERPA